MTKPGGGTDGKKTKPDAESDELSPRYDQPTLTRHHAAVDAHEAKYRKLETTALATGNEAAARGHRGKVTEAHGERSAARYMEGESGEGGRYEHHRMERGFSEGAGYDQLWVKRKPPNDPNGAVEEIVIVEAKGRNEKTGRKAGLGDSKKGEQMSDEWVKAKAKEMSGSEDPKDRALADEILRGIEDGPPPRVKGRQLTGEDPRPPGPSGKPRPGVEDKPPSTQPSGDYTKNPSSTNPS